MNNIFIKKLGVVVALMIACALSANAVPTMRLSADGGATWTVVTDNGPLDSNPTVGFISYNGPVGDWTVSILSALGSPLIGDALNPVMDLGTLDSSVNSDTLIVQMSDTGFTPFANQTFIASMSATTTGTISYNSYRDTGNVLFGTTASYSGGLPGTSPSLTASLLMAEGPFTGGTFQPSNSVVVANGGTAPYSLTLETVIVHAGPAQTQSDAVFYTLPPPACNCALTFNSPASVTNCAGDTIADVVASQDCGSGPTPVLVTVTGAVTNGICPQIITRTNTATDTCGTVHTFVQTITVNCLPDCTVTTSVKTTIVGTTGLKASVADAGPSATYVWTILNGTITAGQGTPTITWTAGTDVNSPISIGITVTSSTGCLSTCGASVRVTPTPPPTSLGSGDTATIGFWHNKNGQGLILGAPNSPALANWLASNFPNLYGSLAGKPNTTVAALFLTDFGVKGQKTDAQVLAGALACYFTSSTLAGNGASKFGFNISPGGTGSKTFNVGSLGTTIGLQNNTSYTVLQILQAANANAPFNSAVFNALNTIFDGINSTGDINS